jgi:hypothetical protein
MIININILILIIVFAIMLFIILSKPSHVNKNSIVELDFAKIHPASI